MGVKQSVQLLMLKLIILPMVSFKEKIGEEVEKQNQKKREIREVRGESLSIFI